MRRSTQDRDPRDDNVDHVARWRASLRHRDGGQDPVRPGTWRLDGLWRAACYQASAEDMERTLAFALDKHLSAEIVAGILDDVKRQYARADRVSHGLAPDPERGEATRAA